MGIDNVKLWFAKNENDEIVTIDDLKDSNTYLCPVCGSDLIPKATESKRITPHFAHVDKSKYNNESMMHFWFKHKFLESGDKFKVVTDKEIEYVCKDAKAEGFELIEAYPFEHNENHAYHGPLTMYKKNGFEVCQQIEGCVVCRKIL